MHAHSNRTIVAVRCLRPASLLVALTVANHIWSFAGESGRNDVNRTFLQPLVSYTTKTFTTFGLNTESSYDWEREQWTVPINATVQQLLKVGRQPLTLQLG